MSGTPKEDLADLVKRIEAEKAAIDAADTPENYAALQVRANALGWRLAGKGRGKSGYSVTMGNRTKLSGLTLHSIGQMIDKASRGA